MGLIRVSQMTIWPAMVVVAPLKKPFACVPMKYATALNINLYYKLYKTITRPCIIKKESERKRLLGLCLIIEANQSACRVNLSLLWS